MKNPEKNKSKTSSKEKQRKMKQLQNKKDKNNKREEILKTLKDNSLNPELAEVLISSKTLGQCYSLKDQLKIEHQKEKLGLTPNDILYSERKPSIDTQLPSEASKQPKILYEKLQKPTMSESESSEILPTPILPKKTTHSQPSVQVSNKSEYIPIEIPEIDPQTLMGYSSAVEVEMEQSTPSSLPIIPMEQEIIEKLRYNNIIIICGETGTGKSTQLPRFLLENGFADHGKIGITQPRRIAAITLAQRVSQETGLELGKKIGYQVRYDSEKISSENLIKFMTDGILLKEIASDFLLSSYSVIIIDEAHERSVNSDVLLGLLSRIVPLRQKYAENGSGTVLKLVIMSATLRTSDFTENASLFSPPPPVISIDSRQFPVSVHFSKSTNSSDFINQALEKVKKIHRNLPQGGILVFVPGKKDVLQLKSLIKQSLPQTEATVLGLFSMLPIKKQLKIFAPHNDKRLVVVSTNVAETSVTIPNIVYVVDSGLEKNKKFSKELQMSKFVVEFISQASASQRSGRAGRTCPGHCYRLYSNAAYSNVFPAFRAPEISNSPLFQVVLQLKSLGIKNVVKFPFPTAPDSRALCDALEVLNELGALRQCRKGAGDVYEITELGKKMADIPVAPRYAKMIAVSIGFCVEKWMCVVVAGMEIEQVFRCSEGETENKTKVMKKTHAKWFGGMSDSLNPLRMFMKFLESGNIEEFCRTENVIEKSLVEMKKLCVQLADIVDTSRKHDLTYFNIPSPDRVQENLILKAVVSGFIDQIAVKADASCSKASKVPYFIQKHIDESFFPDEYRENSNLEYVFIHPSSYLFRKPPEMLAYQHMVFTNKPSLINITEVKSEWLYEVGKNLLHDVKIDGNEGFYDTTNDKMCTWVCGAYGKKMWKLPRNFEEFPECDEKYFWFAKTLLDGKLPLNIDISASWWKLKSSKFTENGIVKIQRALKLYSVASMSSLAKVVIEKNDFLIKELLNICKIEYQEKVNAIWKLSGII